MGPVKNNWLVDWTAMFGLMSDQTVHWYILPGSRGVSGPQVVEVPAVVPVQAWDWFATVDRETL
jgi:hypothetical protein